MKKPIILFMTFLLFSGHAIAQRVSVSATVNTEKILIGEQVQLYLKAVLPNRNTATWFDVDTFPHFEILDKSTIDSQQTTEGLFLQQTITLTSWDSGRWMIPSFRLLNFRTNPLVVSVGYTPMDPDQPYHDIKDNLEVEKPIASNWYWYLLGIAVLIALFLLFFPPKQEAAAAAPPELPQDAYKVAMQRIERLDPGTEARYLYTELVDVFRNYLEKRKNIRSFSKTTDDLSVQMRELQLPPDQYNQLVQVLRMSDMVKFARFLPAHAENEEAIAVIKKNIVAIEQMK